MNTASPAACQADRVCLSMEEKEWQRHKQIKKAFVSKGTVKDASERGTVAFVAVANDDVSRSIARI